MTKRRTIVRRRKPVMLKPSPMKKCAALACKRLVGVKKVFCAGHWAIVPQDLKKALVESYALGQDIMGRIPPEFRLAVSAVVKFIAFREGVLVKEGERDERDDGRGGADEYDNPE